MREISISELTNKELYHICTHGFEDINIMRDAEDFKVAHNLMAIVGYKMGIFVLAYCLMSNHVHFIIEASSAQAAKSYIYEFLRVYSQHLKRKYGLSKILKDLNPTPIIIDSVSYLKACIAYVLRNPLSAKICTRIEDYEWSSCNCYFQNKFLARKHPRGTKLSDMSIRSVRKLLKTRLDLSGCPYEVDQDGKIIDESFINTRLVEQAYMHSGKSFLAYLGKCNDSRMEYELAIKSECNSSDTDMIVIAQELSEKWYGIHNLWELSTEQRCKMIKKIYFSNNTTIPQLSRILGIKREIIRRILSA